MWEQLEKQFIPDHTLKLLACEDDALLICWDSLLVLNLGNEGRLTNNGYQSAV